MYAYSVSYKNNIICGYFSEDDFIDCFSGSKISLSHANLRSCHKKIQITLLSSNYSRKWHLDTDLTN